MYARLLCWLWEQYWGSSPPCEAFGPLIFHNTRSRNRDSMNNILSLIQIELRFNIGSQLLPWYPKLFGYCHVMHLAILREGKKCILSPKLMAIEPAGQAGYCASWGNANIDRVTLSSCFLAKRWANAGNQSGFWLNCYFFNIDLQRFGDLRWELPGSPLLGPRHRNVPRARFGLNFCFQKCVFSF